jgi:hypothetical protein
MPIENPGTTLIVQGNVTYDVVKGPAPGTAALLAARREVMQDLDLVRLLVDLARSDELLSSRQCPDRCHPNHHGRCLT